MKPKKFRVSIKKNNNFAYFINKANPEEFYIYSGSWITALKESKTYNETDLRIEGRYVTQIAGILSNKHEVEE